MNIKKISEKQKLRNKDKAKEAKKLHDLFREIWDEREDEGGFCYCYETGTPMHGSTYRNNTLCYDHVLEKGKKSYPEYKFLKRNILIILPEVHMLKGRNIDKCPKIKEYRNYLLSLHKKGELKDGDQNRNTEDRILE